MFFHEQKKSGLVRLSDCIKYGVLSVAESTKEFNNVLLAQRPELKYQKEIIAKAENGEITNGEAIELIQAKIMSFENTAKGVVLQTAIHNQGLTTILSTCFTLESYINSLAYYLSEHHGNKGRLNGKKLSISKQFNSLSTVNKWIELVKISTGIAYQTNLNDNPFGDLDILFKFRNDHVHDKVVHISNDKSLNRYKGRLPDPVFGLLDMLHVLFAADTYWNLIIWVHNKIGVSHEEFHTHYNLSPWISSDEENETRSIAATYNANLDIISTT